MAREYLSLMLFTFIWTAVSQIAHYKLVLLDDPDALCLDGSPGAYYYSIGQNSDKILLHFEGGGWCG